MSSSHAVTSSPNGAGGSASSSATNRASAPIIGSPRGPKENPFSCFEAFASLKPLMTTDEKGNPLATAEVTWSYPYREKRMLERFSCLDKMAFPTFDTNNPVVPLSGDGTFLFVLTIEGKARDSHTRRTPMLSSVAGDGHSAAASPAASPSGDDASSDSDAQEPIASPSTRARRRRQKQAKEFRQLYGHCISTINGEVFVFLSQFMWVGFFRSLLQYYRVNGEEAGRTLLKALYAVPTPLEPGGSFGIRFANSVLKRPMDLPHLKGIDADPLLLLKVFSDTQLCEILSAMVLVETIIITGPDFGVVSKVIVALRALTASVDSDCHIYAPVLPRSMLGLMASPVPGIFGIVDDFSKDASEACESLEAAVFVQLTSTAPRVAFPEKDRELDVIYSSSARSPSSSSSPQAPPVARKSPRGLLRRGTQIAEDNPPFDGTIMCSSVTFLGTRHHPLPRTSSVFRSTLRRGLTAIRSASASHRSNEDLLMLFVRYFAVHFGHVGSPDFKTEEALQRHRNANRKRSDFKDEVAFFEQFYKCQTCVQMTDVLHSKITKSNAWTTDTFGNMVVQLNPDWYGSELAKYRKEELTPVNSKSSWELLKEGGGSGLALLACCDNVHESSDSEQGPSRNVSSNNTGNSNRSLSGPGGLYLTPDGQGAGNRETIISREDVDHAGLSALANPSTAREMDSEMRLAEEDNLGTAKLRDAM